MDKNYSSLKIIIILSIIALSFIALFLTWNVVNSYIFRLRLEKVITLILVAYTIAVSTVLFQTVTNNKILTPSIMGFDQLYILIQTILIYFVGQARIPGFSQQGQFLLEAAILVLFSSSLFFWLFGKSARNLHLTLLVGVVCGSLFFSLRMLMQIKLDPDLALRLTDVMFANFNKLQTPLLITSLIIVMIVSIIGFKLKNRFDVLTLGRDNAISLGVPYRSSVLIILILTTILVAISTALVGPITFFGLLIASLAYQFSPTSKHAVVLPVAILLGIIFLVGGQFIFERLNMIGRLTFVIEFFGGIIFLFLLIKGRLK